MLEMAAALGLIALFSGSVFVGFVVQARLPEHHRSKDAMEFVQLVMSLLVTFAAIVLGLLTTSVKADFDRAQHDRVRFAAELTQIDRCLRNYGPETTDAREQLRSYTAAIIASTWPSEPPPRDVAYPDTSDMARVGANPVLASLLNTVGVELQKLQPSDAVHRAMADSCNATFQKVLDDRWSVIEDIYSKMSTPFFVTVVFWMTIVFAGLGLRAPAIPLTWIVMGFCIASVTSVFVIILDLNEPYGGLFGISSTSMRVALSHMLAP